MAATRIWPSRPCCTMRWRIRADCRACARFAENSESALRTSWKAARIRTRNQSRHGWNASEPTLPAWQKNQRKFDWFLRPTSLPTCERRCMTCACRAKACSSDLRARKRPRCGTTANWCACFARQGIIRWLTNWIARSRNWKPSPSLEREAQARGNHSWRTDRSPRKKTVKIDDVHTVGDVRGLELKLQRAKFLAIEFHSRGQIQQKIGI